MESRLRTSLHYRSQLIIRPLSKLTFYILDDIVKFMLGTHVIYIEHTFYAGIRGASLVAQFILSLIATLSLIVSLVVFPNKKATAHGPMDHGYFLEKH